MDKMKKIEIYSPINGKVINLNKVKDEVFAQKMLGDGIAIQPTTNDFVSPIKGKVVTAFPTGHAYGIRHKSGFEVLVHIGLDSVNLKGEGFEVKTKQNAKVKVGTPLVSVDLKAISKKIPSTDTPIVFTQDSMKNFKLNIEKTGDVKIGDVIATIEKK